MARYELEILGDNSQFNRVVSQSMRQLDELSANTGGFFDNIAGSAGRATGALNALTGMSPGLAALGIAGAAAGLGLAAISKTSEYVNGLNQISTNTGVSVEMLQKLQQQFSATGLEAEKFGDMNKDAMDKLGDSFRNGGGGVADDLKEWGIELKEYTKYAGDAQGGIKAIIDTFYKLREAGKSQAEITNAMETIASDSSHMISTLQQYGNATEALSAIQSQNARITNETAAEYKEFQKNVDTLGTNLQGLAVTVVAPLVEEINKLWGVFNKDWNSAEFTSMLSHFFYDGDNAIAKGLRKMSDVPDEGYSPAATAATNRLKALTSGLQAEVQTAVKEAEAQTSANKKIADKEAEAAKKEADTKAKAAAAEAKQRAAQAKAELQKQIQERQQALAQLNTLNAQMYSGQGQALANSSQQLQASIGALQGLLNKGYITQEQFVQKRQALIQASSGQFKALILGASPEQLTSIIQSVDQVYANQTAELQARRDKDLIDQQTYNQQLQAAEQAHQEQMNALKGINGQVNNSQSMIDMGFGTDQDQMIVQQQALDTQKKQFDDNNQAMANAGIITHQQYLDQKARLDQAYALKSQQISMTEVQSKLGIYNSLAGGMAGIISGVAGENSKAAKAAFAVSKGTAIAEGMLSAYQASSKAIAMYPGPVGYAMAAASYAQVLGQVLSMKSVNLTGMAHDGIDNVPSEGTWLLQKGERVVDDRTNGDLKNFLSNQNQQAQSPTTINAPVTIQGNVSSDNREVLEVLKKHGQTVALIVQDAQRRKM